MGSPLAARLGQSMPVGNEGAGVVEAVGSEVTQVRPGDHVICSGNPHCGHCFYCERDLPILCEPFSRNQPRGLLLDGRYDDAAKIFADLVDNDTFVEFLTIPAYDELLKTE